MKIVFPMYGLNVSGGVRLLTAMASGLAQRGHEVILMVPRHSCVCPFPLDQRVRLHTGSLDVGNRYVRKLVDTLWLASLVPTCDAVIANGYLTAYPAAISKIFGRSKLVAYYVAHYEPLVMGTFSDQPAALRPLISAVASFSYVLPLRKMALSNWIRQMVRERHGRESVVIPPFVDLTTFRPEGPRGEGREGPMVLCTGRLARWKGMLDLIAALELLRDKYPDLTLVNATQEPVDIVGSFACETVRPASDGELARLYRSADVFAFPSWWEGLGLPPLEAMACGAAVVTTDCGGVRDFARDGENCLIVPPRDPVAMADAISRLIDDRELAHRLGATGAATAERFPVTKMIDAVEEFLEQFLGAEQQ